MVQMSSLTTRSKPDRLPPATEIPSLLLKTSEIKAPSCGSTSTVQDVEVARTVLRPDPYFPDPLESVIYDACTAHVVNSKRHHPNDETKDIKPNICRVCQAQFSNEAKLAFHLQEVHMSSQKPQDSKPNTKNGSESSVPVPENSVTTACKTEPAEKPNSDSPKPVPQKRKKKILATPLARPKRRKRANPESEHNCSPSAPRPTNCVLCNTNYRTNSAWEAHAVHDHILKKDPEPRVEMNYVDVKTINNDSSAGEGSIITTAKVNGTPGRGIIQEQLKLTFCREKGSYVVKKPSSPLGDLPPGIKASSGGEDESCSSTNSTDFREKPYEIVGGNEIQTTGTASVTSLPHRDTGSSGVEINMLSDKENSEPEVVKAISQSTEIPRSELVSKVPTSGTVVYLSSSASESDRTLANTGNSHMVIIQNDILHIGAEADEENIQRITAATTANNGPQFRTRKVMEAMRGVLTEELNISVDKEPQQRKDSSPVLSVLNMSPFARPMTEEVTTMISEEIPNTNALLEKDINEQNYVLRGSERDRRRDSDDNSRDSDNMQLRIAIGENSIESPSHLPQESIPQDSPKEHFPNDFSDSNSDVGRERTFSDANRDRTFSDASRDRSFSDANRDRAYSDVGRDRTYSDGSGGGTGNMPIHITLPCGIEIEQLPIPSVMRRESIESNQSEDIDVDDSGLGDSRTNSELVIDEDPTSREAGGDDADDFRCKVCNALFTSDDELETHFSEVHFRGIANNILEPPESPFVGGGGVGDRDIMEPPPAHASSNGSIFRTSSNENIPRNFSMQPGQAHLLPPAPGSRSERRTSDDRLTEFRVTNGNFTNSQFFMRAEIVPAPPSSQAGLHGMRGLQANSNTDRSGATRHLGQIPSSLADTLPQRSPPEGQASLSRSIANLQAQLNRNPPALPSSRPGGSLLHSAPFQYLTQQQPPQPQSGRDPSSNKTYPNALHNALNSVVQLGSQRPLPLGGRHGSQEEARILESLSSGNRQAQTQGQTPSTQQQRNHLLAMAHHQRQQQYQLLQQQSMRSRQQHDQQRQAQATVDLQRQQAIMMDLEQQQRQIRTQQSHLQQYVNATQNLLGKRPSPQEIMNSLQKQPRTENQDRRPPPQGIGRTEGQGQGSNQSQLASALGNGGVRLGSSITLSVCPDGRDSQNPNLSLLRSSIASGQQQQQKSPIGSLGSPPSANMASALAVRGVTVSPASPTSNVQENGGIPVHRMQPQISTSPNQMRSPPHIPNSVSVIQNGSSHSSSTPSPPSHQFAMPQNPAPRSSSVDRPERPPTVDLTTDEINAAAYAAAQQSRYLERRGTVGSVTGSTQAPSTQRPPTRPAVACNLCGVLFCSMANLEEHKIHRHGLRPPTGPGSQGRESGHTLPSPPLRTQQSQGQGQGGQSTRTGNAVGRPPGSSGSSQRSLFIPLLDITRMDTSKLKRLEELGVCSMIPLQGNDRALGQMGIPLLLPTINLRDGPQLPWDQLQPVGPVYAPSQVASNYAGSRPLALPPASSTNH